jgi:Flp pilus assembly protein TadG
MKNLARDEKGASAVEFALIASLLFVVLFGIIQFGIAYNRTQGLQAAAREGARIASIGGTQADIKTRVQAAQSLFQASDVQVKIDYSQDNGASWTTICNDGGGGGCNSTATPTPCGVTGLSQTNLVQVTATVPASLTKYAIVIPLWGNKAITYSSSGAFRCEKTS